MQRQLSLLVLAVTASLGLAACGRKTEVKEKLVDIPQYSALRDVRSIPSPAIKDAAQAVVLIRTAAWSGTGFFVEGGLLFTNNHVLGAGSCLRTGCFIQINTAYQAGTEPSDAINVFAVPERVDAQLDAAVFRIFNDDKTTAFEAPATLQIAPESAAALIGRKVFLIGHPAGGLKKWAEGSVFASEGEWVAADYFSLSGTSGSPVLDEAGKVVGINHRSSNDGGALLTKRGLQHTAIFSSGAALQGLLDAPAGEGLGLVDIGETTDAKGALRQKWAFYNGRQKNLKTVVEGETSILALLAQDCDSGLAKPAYTDPDDYEGAVGACRSALNWISCVPETLEGNAQLSCIEGDERSAWEKRYELLATKTLEFWKKSMNYDAVDPAGLFATSAADRSAAWRQAFKEELQRAAPALTLGLAATILAATEADTLGYQGVNLMAMVKGFRAEPQHARFAGKLLDAHLSLYQAELATGREVLNALLDLLQDPEVSIQDKLALERIAYVNGLL